MGADTVVVRIVVILSAFSSLKCLPGNLFAFSAFINPSGFHYAFPGFIMPSRRASCIRGVLYAFPAFIMPSRLSLCLSGSHYHCLNPNFGFPPILSSDDIWSPLPQITTQIAETWYDPQHPSTPPKRNPPQPMEATPLEPPNHEPSHKPHRK